MYNKLFQGCFLDCPTYSIRRGEVSRVGVAGGDEGVEGVRGGVERLTVAVEDEVVVTVVGVVLLLLLLVLVLTGLDTATV